MKKRKLKIAFVSFYQGDVNRGVESFVHELATRLSFNHTVTVIQRSKSSNNSPYMIKSLPISVDWQRKDERISLMDRLFLTYWNRRIMLHALKAFSYVVKEKYDIIIPLNNGWQPIIIKLATLLSKSKLILVGQSGLGWNDRISSYTFPAHYVALTEVQKKWLHKVNPLLQVSVIYNGVDVRRFSNQIKLNTTKLKRPIVLIVAALVDWKRIDLAVKAVAKTSASLLIVGEGSEKTKVKALLEKEMPDRYRILSVPYQEIHKVYRSADIFTYPTVPWESFGIVLLEAMASGLPVVATDDPIRREIVGDAGIFVDPTDTNAYAKALQKACESEWGDKPLKQADKFDWDEIAHKYEKLLLETAK